MQTKKLHLVQTIGESSYEVRGFRTRFTSLYELEKLMSSQEEQESRLVTLLEQVASQNATETSYSNIQLKNRDHANELQKSNLLKFLTKIFILFYKNSYFFKRSYSLVQSISMGMFKSNKNN